MVPAHRSPPAAKTAVPAVKTAVPAVKTAVAGAHRPATPHARRRRRPRGTRPAPLAPCPLARRREPAPLRSPSPRPPGLMLVRAAALPNRRPVLTKRQRLPGKPRQPLTKPPPRNPLNTTHASARLSPLRLKQPDLGNDHTRPARRRPVVTKRQRLPGKPRQPLTKPPGRNPLNTTHASARLSPLRLNPPDLGNDQTRPAGRREPQRRRPNAQTAPTAGGLPSPHPDIATTAAATSESAKTGEFPSAGVLIETSAPATPTTGSLKTTCPTLIERMLNVSISKRTAGCRRGPSLKRAHVPRRNPR